jgi:hypothetical protein
MDTSEQTIEVRFSPRKSIDRRAIKRDHRSGHRDHSSDDRNQLIGSPRNECPAFPGLTDRHEPGTLLGIVRNPHLSDLACLTGT